MNDLDGWTDTAIPDWTSITIQFDPADPAKTIPLSWAQDMLQRQYKANPASFGRKLADVVADWSQRKYQDGQS